LEPTDQYGFSSLNGYQFVSQGILCTDSSIYLSLRPVLNEDHGELSVINFIIFVLSRFRASLFAANHLLM
jgi:hypothetical protein